MNSRFNLKTFRTTCLAALLAVVATTAAEAQRFPRRNVTRPCPIYAVPNAATIQYKTQNRSRSATAISNRFVYLDNPLQDLSAVSANQVKQSTIISSLETTREATGGEPPNPATPAVEADSNPTIPNAKTVQEQLAQQVNQLSNVITAPGQDLPAGAQKRLTEVAADIAAKANQLSAAANASGLSEAGNIQQKITSKLQTIQATPGGDSAIDRDNKLFQWRQNNLQIDHCQVSKIAVTLSRTGDWKVNLRADQNRVGSFAARQFNPTAHIKRNKFAVVFRCYGNMRLTPGLTTIGAGKPVLAAIQIQEFVVENGEPKFVVESGNSKSLENQFDLIDRVEIEFYYYK